MSVSSSKCKINGTDVCGVYVKSKATLDLKMTYKKDHVVLRPSFQSWALVINGYQVALSSTESWCPNDSSNWYILQNNQVSLSAGLHQILKA